MISDKCLCKEDLTDIHNNLFMNSTISDTNNFIKELLSYKCRFFQLTEEQIERSRINQNHLLSQFYEKGRQDETPSKREKRETKKTTFIVKSRTPENTSIVQLRIPIVSLQNTLQSFIYKMLSLSNVFKFAALFLLIAIGLLWLALAAFASLCGKSGFCLPFMVGCTKRARLF